MRILMLVHGFNALSQRLHVELREAGHDVTVEFDVSDALTIEAVDLAQPDLILAPYLKRMIPEQVWRNTLCLVIHPGPPGDAGPAALDWAILEGQEKWGVSLFQATGDYDAGPVWASRTFQMRPGTKSSLYRNEVTDAAVACVHEALDRIETGTSLPPPGCGQDVHFRTAPSADQRAIDWAADDTETVLRKVRASDGMPGARALIGARMLYLHDAHPTEGLDGSPGQLIARCGPAVAVATIDGAVWIGRMRETGGAHRFKLPATQVVQSDHLPERDGYQEIDYRESGLVGFLRFNFLNGAMGTQDCERLLKAYQEAASRPTRVLVLEGGDDIWSNGMDLNRIEASSSPADESWHNINAMDDLAEAVLRTTDKLTVAAVGGNAGAGGVFLARACDEVWLRSAVVLNPHYQDMGNLFGSEFWTYSLPRFSTAEDAESIVKDRLPIGAAAALRLGLANDVVDGCHDDFREAVAQRAEKLAGAGFDDRINEKRARRRDDEARKPLLAYREEELQHMKQNFFGFDPSYHVARSNFVHKVPKARTPLTLAHHRDANGNWQSSARWKVAS